MDFNTKETEGRQRNSGAAGAALSPGDSRKNSVGASPAAILSSISDPLFVLNKNWCVEFMNEAAARALAPLRRPAGNTGKCELWNEFPLLAGGETEKVLRQAFSSKKTLHLETEFPGIKGWFEIRIYPAEFGLCVYFRDISEKRTAELAQAHLAAVVEGSDDAIITMSTEGIIQSWNEGAERMFGYTAAEVLGKSVTILIPPGNEDEEPRILKRLLQGDRIDHYETERMCKDGRVLNVSLTVSPIYDRREKIVGVSKISRDITQRKLNEAALRRNEEELRAMANSIPHLAWMAKPDGSVVWYNTRWFEYTGSTFEEMEGWGWQKVMHPAHLPRVLEQWRESIRTGAPYSMEVPVRGADGRFRWFLSRANAVRDSEGHIVRWFGTNTDVDEVNRAQQALAEESRILELLNQTGEAIASQLDLESVVQKVTDSATELTGAKFGAFFYNVLNDQGEAFMLYTLSGAPREAFAKFGQPRATPLFGPTFRGEPPIRSDDITKDPRYGKWGPHHGMPTGHLPVRSYLAVPVVSRDGEVVGGLFFGHPEPGVFTEKSERLVVGMAAQAAVALDNARLYDAAQRELQTRRQIEEKLRQAQDQLRAHANTLEEEVAERTAMLRETIQELEAFSYSISHDMRSPLRAMQGYSEALLEDYSHQLDDEGQLFLQKIRRGASRMDLLIQDVLAYSRVAKGEIQLHPVNPLMILEDVLQSYPALQQEHADITIEPDMPRVLGHEAYLTQIFSNILGNAVKFISPGIKAKIHVRAQPEGDMVRLEFRDNGIGIAPEHQEQIFQIFGRVYSEKKYEGTGIGLAIVKKAAERMGGSVTVESSLGVGSTFIVRLKLAQ